MMYDVAIIASVIPARYNLLERSLVTWQRSAEMSGLNVAICLYMEDFLHGWPDMPAISYGPTGVLMATSPARSGSHIYGYNHFAKHVKAKTYIFTHPDLLFPWSTVGVAHENVAPNTYVAFKCFWIPQGMTENLNAFPWRSPLQLEQYEDLYIGDLAEHGPFYANRGVRKIETWESTTTWAMDAATLNRITPFVDFKEQGADDPYLAGLRSKLGIRNHTIQDPILFHQWHPSTWNGDHSRAVRLATEAIANFKEK